MGGSGDTSAHHPLAYSFWLPVVGDWVTLLLFVLFKDLPQSTRLFAFLCLGRKTIVLSKMPGLVTQSRLLELEVMLQGVPKKVLIEQNRVLWG